MFSDVPLGGNALAVFADASGLSSQVMQRTARELNLSETVFIVSADAARPVESVADRAVASARIRIFTPASELPFAGHPVLGTGFVVGEQTGASVIQLETPDRTVPVSLVREGETIVSGEMEHAVPEPEAFPREDELLAALGLSGSELPVEGYRNGPLHVYVTLGSEDQVAALAPDLGALARLGDALAVSCFAVSGTRVKTRMFSPVLGVAEDPGTGSAAGPLLLHLVRHGVLGPDQPIEIRQGEEIGRRSLIRVRLSAHGVVVGGDAVTVARGEYRLG